ncbi:hypothetical protein SLE2022_322480 [Rubroshorea leprosula]
MVGDPAKNRHQNESYKLGPFIHHVWRYKVKVLGESICPTVTALHEVKVLAFLGKPQGIEEVGPTRGRD